MILVAHAEEAAEGHDGIGDFSGRFVDHHIVNRAEIIAGGVVDVCALNLVGAMRLPVS
jgi:hypothetical protein